MVFFTLAVALSFLSCSRMGYGVLLWSIDDPPIDSGTVLPVYIRSNIEKKWVVGVPESIRGNRDYKLEIPLAQMEFIGSKGKAVKWAEDFAEHALMYAETLLDGLPIREATDNNAKRVYRLRLGEIIKIIDLVKGNPPISTTGDPLPGDWYKVMTIDGVTGYCFSYRLRIFNQNEEPVNISPNTQRNTIADPNLEMILSKKWSPESYLDMINSKRIDIQHLEKKYLFDPGQEVGTARIVLPDLERKFTYERISPDGDRQWIFEGTNLQMILRQNNTLTVQFHEGGGARRTLTFVSLPNEIEDIIIQEKARRDHQYMTIYNNGPVFTSNNYGTITLLQSGGFTWKGYDLLVPQVIPSETNGTGRINMDLYITGSLEERYNGAFTFQFTDIRINNTICFLYGLENQSLRLEVIPDFGIDSNVVMRRSPSPTVLYFYRDSPQ